MNVAEVDALVQRYQRRIDEQRTSITRLIAFLNSKGLTDEFNEWEESKRIDG